MLVNMQLYMLMCGKSKDKMKPIMIDQRRKCENYMIARTASKSTKSKWYDIVPAEKGAKVWRKDTTNQWTNYNLPGPQLVKRVK
jgi:hypothetical protein